VACDTHGTEARTERHERWRRRHPDMSAADPRIRCSTPWWRGMPRRSSRGSGSFRARDAETGLVTISPREPRAGRFSQSDLVSHPAGACECIRFELSVLLV